MTRAARSILGALYAGAVCYALAALAGRGCELAVVQVHPAVRAWDAGRDR